MDFNPLLAPKIQNYILEKTGTSITQLALQKNPFEELDYKVLLNQIEARTKSKDKLPTWFDAQNIIYPSKISLEQTSSEATARYKASLVSGNSLIDLTGGFGVDDYYFAQLIAQVHHCEINPELSAIVEHNFAQLGVSNITCHANNSEQVLKELNQTFDWIYIDPSRRNDAKGKVFMLKDCLPNVPDLLSFYFNYSKAILIKTAPILDLSAGLSELKYVKNIHIIALENEVKELLWELEEHYIAPVNIKTVNLKKGYQELFSFALNTNHKVDYCLPKKYLYEPNSAIMKSGGFDAISEEYSISKLHQHSHLYTSEELIDFPGRVFEIVQQLPYSKKEMKQFIEQQKMNITTRNFPDSVEQIRKKWKVKEGGSLYCFFTTDLNNDKIALICTKINS
ncbi:class I SAM-dependent methyltransferase [Flavobacterium sp. SUN046]|uniref:class I SAM-dependent methyltransferase n=1 Tax=Flavobacterium sp. SUN046 TaxID=3002440 RepID=UPI002DBA1AEA|nr:class I SAM-dependent methyltransferase [Flavobacterium sp. SUN046]MEC4049008.1 class I SAM-dependent methyltransferase [Flavobacterium sp. SUN046]